MNLLENIVEEIAWPNNPLTRYPWFSIEAEITHIELSKLPYIELYMLIARPLVEPHWIWPTISHHGKWNGINSAGLTPTNSSQSGFVPQLVQCFCPPLLLQRSLICCSWWIAIQLSKGGLTTIFENFQVYINTQRKYIRQTNIGNMRGTDVL